MLVDRHPNHLHRRQNVCRRVCKIDGFSDIRHRRRQMSNGSTNNFSEYFSI